MSIGTRERALDFARETGFPAEFLLADPGEQVAQGRMPLGCTRGVSLGASPRCVHVRRAAENATYDALGLLHGVSVTFLDIQTPLAFKKRIEEGNMGDLADIMPRWKPWIPPKNDQAFQQVGAIQVVAWGAANGPCPHPQCGVGACVLTRSPAGRHVCV